MFFEDGLRRIDFMLAWEENHEDVARDKKKQKRELFHESIREAGLQCEFVPAEESFDKRTSFLKVHAPTEILEMNAKVMGIKPPVKEFVLTSFSDNTLSESSEELINTALTSISSRFESSLVPPEPRIFRPFFPEIFDKFVVKERSSDLSPGQRSLIVWQLLTRARYQVGGKDKVGIERLIRNGTYNSVFPLHEGDYSTLSLEKEPLEFNDRRVLYMEWGRINVWSRRQPMWLIKRYFGPKIAMYFAWLQFYTQALVPPAILGLLCMFYSALTLDSKDFNSQSFSLCSEDTGNSTMCPVCDRYCKYWTLKDSCLLSKVTYFVDNDATVVFAIFMSFWATLFLELWKRQQAIYQWEWDLTKQDSVDEGEDVRLDSGRKKNWRMNPITMRREPFLDIKEKTWRYSVTFWSIFLLLSTMLSALISVIIFRVFIIEWMHQTTHDSAFSSHAKLIGAGAAALVNFLIISVFELIYPSVARFLTNLEQPRTELDFEKSYSYKLFLFQFINYYSSLIYTAFFKGRFYTYPGDVSARQSSLTLVKTDICDAVGCTYEVSALLGLLMMARQMVAHFKEVCMPKILNFWRSYKWKKTQTEKITLKRWEKDFQLQDVHRLHLHDEYIEMIIQYGFVTLFVSVFPLAPLLALINNILEIRLDAYKYTTQTRRPIARRVRDIGVWAEILQLMTYLAVITNAFVIAFSSSFIPRMVYKFLYSPDGSLDGFMAWQLTPFNTSHWGDPTQPDYFGPLEGGGVEVCYFPAHRDNPESSEQYVRNSAWLTILIARLTFVGVFEHVVFFVTKLLAYLIPETPASLSVQMARERIAHRENQFKEVQNRTLRRKRQENKLEEPQLERKSREPVKPWGVTPN